MTWPATMVPFENALEDQTPGQAKIQRSDYKANGEIPVVDQGQKPVAGFTDDAALAYQGPLPAILFGDHTLVIKYVASPFALGADGVRVLTAKPPFIGKFLYYYLLAKPLQSRGYSRHFKFLREKEFPLTGPSEQGRIVELLEQADGLRRKRAEADALADQILPALFCHFFGEPTANPKGWPTPPLHTLVDFVSGATPSKEIPEFWDGDVPWVSPKDMKRHELHDAMDHVTERAVVETGLKRIPAGVPLIVVRGMILAHTVPVCLTRVSVTINQDMKALAPKGVATGEFLQWALITQHRALLRLVTTAAHGTRKLDTEALGALQIPVPPPNQRDLIERWGQVVNGHAETARKRAACREGIAKIWQVMLHRAFTGDLTAKWREAHMKELLAEMEHQARILGSPQKEMPLG